MSFDEFFSTFNSTLGRLENQLLQARREIAELKKPDKLTFNLTEAAAATGMGYESLYNKCKAGKIKFSQDGPGGNILITRQDLEQYIDQHAVKTEASSTNSIVDDGKEFKLKVSGKSKRGFIR